MQLGFLRQVLLGYSSLIVAGAMSCRSHEAFCAGAVCANAASGAGGEGSAGGEAGAPDVAGQAGAPEPPCTSDRQCDNRLPCDGAETCVEGKCQDGEPLQCPFSTMTCDDEAAEPCVFESPSPWLVIGTGPTLVAQPTNTVGIDPPLVLATTSVDYVIGYFGVRFSQRGDVAMSLLADREFSVRLQYLRFGQGLPEPLRNFPDVPNIIKGSGDPELALDSSYALVLDDATGTFLAPLADTGAPTLRIPREEIDIDRAGFCQEAPTFYYEVAGGGNWLAWPTADGIEKRAIPGGYYVTSSSDQRVFVRRVIEDPEQESPQGGVVVSICSPEGSDTVYESASDAFIGPGPGSGTLFIKYEDGSLKQFSLEAPEEKEELWSSQGLALAELQFTTDEQHLVAMIDDVWHVMSLSEGDTPKPIGLAESPLMAPWSVWTAGTTALLARLPQDSEQPNVLLWQPLAGQQAPHILLPASASSRATLTLGGDGDEVFIVLNEEDGSDTLLRVRLDTEEPLLEELLSLDSNIESVVSAPDGSGLAILVGSPGIQATLWWAPLSPERAVGAPFILSPDAQSVAFQPVP